MAMNLFGSVANAIAEVVKAFVETEVSEDNIIDLFAMVYLPNLHHVPSTS